MGKGGEIVLEEGKLGVFLVLIQVGVKIFGIVRKI